MSTIPFDLQRLYFYLLKQYAESQLQLLDLTDSLKTSDTEEIRKEIENLQDFISGTEKHLEEVKHLIATSQPKY